MARDVSANITGFETRTGMPDQPNPTPVTPLRSVPALTASIGRVLFLAGTFLMVTGDWPRSTILANRWVMPLKFLAWPWLYLTLLAAACVLLLSSRVLRVPRPTTANFLHVPIALLVAAFLLSVVFSLVPPLSWWAFGCFLAIIGFTLAVTRIVEDETSLASLSIVIAAAALFLAVRVIMWRLDQGSTFASPFHIGNNAWLGKNQISWVLNLLAPLLLARFLAERAVAATLLYGGAWLLSAAAVYLVFSSTGAVAFVLTTVSLWVLNARYWRRSLTLFSVFTGLAFGLVAVSATPPSERIASLIRPDRYTTMVIRQDIWRQTVQMIVDRPVIGIGLGTYDDIAPSRYGPIVDPWFFRRGWHAHNTPLHMLAETGAVGFLAWCYFWFTIVRFVVRRWRDGDMLGRLNSSAVLCFLLAFLIHSMTDVIVAARVHASLRMNLTIGLLVIYGIRLASRTGSSPMAPPGHA